MKYFIFFISIALLFIGCEGGGGSNNATAVVESSKSSTDNKYDYIPKGNELTDKMAIRFLDMATFGATPASIAELKNKGVVKGLMNSSLCLLILTKRVC